MLFNRIFVPLKPFKRCLETYSIKNLLNIGEPKELTGPDELIRVIGWVKSFRDQKEVKFLSINDGSDQHTLQLVLLNNQINWQVMKYKFREPLKRLSKVLIF